jgi:hypothetical protein
MKHLQLLIVLILISISTFASKNESITNQNEFETQIPPTCTETKTVSRSGTYECNGTIITVTATSTQPPI